MSKSTIRDRIRKIGKLIGIDNLYPHSLRKTSINLLAEVWGIDLASEFANQSGVDVTRKHYIKKTTARERKLKLLEIKKENWILKKEVNNNWKNLECIYTIKMGI